MTSDGEAELLRCGLGLRRKRGQRTINPARNRPSVGSEECGNPPIVTIHAVAPRAPNACERNRSNRV
jgi:hypothetical protein